MEENEFKIIVDTREQQPWHFKHYATAVSKVDTGDYTVEGLEKNSDYRTQKKRK